MSQIQNLLTLFRAKKWAIFSKLTFSKFVKKLLSYSLISIRQNYNFDMLATIWHEIVSWFLTISQDFWWFAQHDHWFRLTCPRELLSPTHTFPRHTLVSDTHMYQTHTCTQHTLAPDTHMHPSTLAPDTHLHPTHTCTRHTLAPDTHMHPTHTCIRHTLAPDTHFKIFQKSSKISKFLVNLTHFSPYYLNVSQKFHRKFWDHIGGFN